jgi:NitT/TauT family transport system substrate-binding protein
MAGTPAATTGGSAQQTAGDGDLQHLSIRINWAPAGQHAPLYYGIAKGYFADEGIDLEILDGKGSQLAIDDVAAGNTDIALAGSGPAILGMGQGREIVSIATPIGAGTYGFFVDKKLGIDNIKDLKGHSVLITPGSPETPLIAPVLKLAGVEESDVPLISVDAAAKVNSYVNGQGDAMATTIPFYAAHVQPKRPSTELLFSDFGLALPDYSFLVKKSDLESKHALFAGFLRAYFKASAEASEDPEAAVQALKDARGDIIQYDTELASWNAFQPFLCSDNQDGDLLGKQSAEDWKIAVDLLVKYSGLSGDVQPEDLYTNEFFEGTDPVTSEKCET